VVTEAADSKSIVIAIVFIGRSPFLVNVMASPKVHERVGVLHFLGFRSLSDRVLGLDGPNSALEIGLMSRSNRRDKRFYTG
jgi:hypothetical protein